MSGILSDFRFSLRQVRRTPGFSAAAVAVLALGIGLNAAMFGMCYSLVFAPRPFERPGELVQLYSRSSTDALDDYRRFSFPAFEEMRGSGRVFSGVLAHRTLGVGLNETDQRGGTRRAVADMVSAEFFSVLGVPLAQGRAFTAEESRPGSEIPVAIASHALWKRAGLDSSLVGRTIRINERPFTIVGIAPEGFMGTSAFFGPEVFLPLGVFDSVGNSLANEASPRSLARPDAFTLLLIGRLKAGVAREGAEEALKLTSAAMERAFPVEYRAQRFTLHPLPRFVSGTAPNAERAVVPLALALLGMTGSVLLIVCLNLASMFLARGQARRREFAIRLAVGGGRARIVRQLLVEGLLLSAVGGALGVALGRFGIDALVAALIEKLPVSVALDFAATPSMLCGTALFSVMATLLFAFGPALRHTGRDVIGDLKQQAGTASARRIAFLPRHPLVAAQVSLSVALLISAGLFIQMTRRAVSLEPGFDAAGTVVMEVDAGLAGRSEAEGLSLYARIEDRLRALPGVRAASVAATVPFAPASFGETVRRAGASGAAGEAGNSYGARWNAVGAGHFEALGLSLRGGRFFTDAESRVPQGPKVAVIDDVLARQLWPDGEAIGRSLELAPRNQGEAPSEAMRVIGVASPVLDDAFDESPGGAIYVPFAQGYRAAAFFEVRGPASASQSLADAVQAEVRAEAPDLPAFRALTFENHRASSLDFWGLRLTSSLFLCLGLVAATISLVGVYGTMSYGVLRRTRELGIRLAIGATPSGVRLMVLREGLRLGLAGVAVGLLLGIGMGRLMDSLFVEVGAFDAATFTLTPALLLAACVGAAWLPARRATTVDPVTALRAD